MACAANDCLMKLEGLGKFKAPKCTRRFYAPSKLRDESSLLLCRFVCRFCAKRHRFHPLRESAGSGGCYKTISLAVSHAAPYDVIRSEEHTSELQSLRHLVC